MNQTKTFMKVVCCPITKEDLFYDDKENKLISKNIDIAFEMVNITVPDFRTHTAKPLIK
jgi:uncharacterized protein YbaR (Trm112 family)